MNWAQWIEYRDRQMADEESNPEDCIPAMECDCPERKVGW